MAEVGVVRISSLRVVALLCVVYWLLLLGVLLRVLSLLAVLLLGIGLLRMLLGMGLLSVLGIGLLSILGLVVLLLLAVLLLVVLLWLIVLGLILILWLLVESSRAQSLEEHEKFRFGDDPILIEVKGLEESLGFLSSEPFRLVHLHVKLVEEGVQLFDIEGPAAIVVKDIKSLVDEHLENIVVQFCHVFKAFINCYYLISYNVNLYFKKSKFNSIFW